MHNTLLSVRVGLTFLIGLALIWVSYETLSEGSLWGERNTYEISGQFDTLKQLKNGDDVRLSGVRIGTVRGTMLRNGKAVAVLAIDNQYKIPKDATASIDMSGLLGGNFVGINVSEEATAPYLAEGDTIETIKTPDFNTILAQVGEIGAKVDNLVSEFTGSLSGEEGEGGLFGGGFGALIEKLERIIDENEQAVKNTLANLDEVTTNLAEGKGTLGKLINDTEAYDKLMDIANNLEGASKDISSVMTDVRGVVDDVKQGKGALGVLIYNEEVGKDIARITGNVREVSDQLASGKGTLGRLIMEDDLYESTQSLISKAGKTLDGLGESGPISAVGAAAGALF